MMVRAISTPSTGRGFMRATAMLFVLASGVLWGQTPPDSGKDRPDEPRPRAAEIPPATSLSVEGLPVDISRTPGRVRVFNAEDIAQAGARTLGEFLTIMLPGQAQDPGQPGMMAQSYQGGSRPQDTLVLLDGMPLTDGTSRSADLNRIPIIGIDRIEVLEGGASSRFGTHAMGGVIALFSAGTTGAGGHGEIAGGGGGGGQKKGGVFPAYGWDSGWVRFGSLYHEDQPITETAKPFRMGTLFMGFGQKLGERASLSVTYRNFYQTVPLPFERATPLERVFDSGRWAEYRGNQALATLRFEVSKTMAWDLRAGVVNLRRIEPDDDTNLQDRFRSRRGQFAAGLHLTVGAGFGLSLLLDAQEERADLPGLATGMEQGRNRSLAAALEARWDLTPSLRMVADLRQERVVHRYTGLDGRELDAGTYNPLSLRVGLNQALGLGFRLYALAGTGFNTPLLAQTMVNAREGRPLLHQEKSTFYQVGLGWDYGRFSSRLEASRTRYEDLISPLASDVAGPLAPRAVAGALVPVDRGFANGGAFRHQGVEATVGYRTATRLPLGIDAFIRNQEARDLGAPEENRFGTPLVQNRPFTTHGLKLSLTGVKVRVETRWNRVGRRYESVHTFQCSDLEPLVTPTFVAYDDLAVTTTYTYSKLLSIIVRGEHLAQKNLSVTDWQGRKTDLQDNAALVYGIPAPRPTFAVELRFRY